MSSQLAQDIIAIQTNDYLSLAILTAVGYDYILTFSREIEYIWKKPWGSVSTLFVIFLGSLFRAILYNSLRHIWEFFSSWPGKGEMSVLFYWWGFWVFMCAADMVMILRVWALYNQSRLVLRVLLALYAIEVISLFIRDIVESIWIGSGSIVGTAQILHFSFCLGTDFLSPAWLVELPFAVAIVLGAFMCLLTAIQFVKQLCQVYRTRCFHQSLNRYMKCLARDGMVYFIVVLLFAVFALLATSAQIQTEDGWLMMVTAVLQGVPPVTLIPRFILSLRELYAHEVQSSTNIDTAFGIGSEVGQSTLRNTVIRFAVGRDENEEQGDEIQMAEWIQDARHSSSTCV